MKKSSSEWTPSLKRRHRQSVTLPRPSFQLAIKETRDSLFVLQLDTIKYAFQQHERKLTDGSRAGYFIGDGTILENDQRGRGKAIWVSVSNDLKCDVQPDLHDIGAAGRINFFSLNAMKYRYVLAIEGIVFATYASLRSASQSGEHSRLCVFILVCHKCGRRCPLHKTHFLKHPIRDPKK
jgi:hypothetical protein